MQRKIGCSTISLCCVQNGEISKYANYPIEVVVGPEVVTGSTRMKAGTAQKMVLNMISTSVMIKRGKVFGNLRLSSIQQMKNKNESCFYCLPIC